MQNLGMQTHLNYLSSFVISAKEIRCEIEWERLHGDARKAERKLEEVGRCSSQDDELNDGITSTGMYTTLKCVVRAWC